LANYLSTEELVKILEQQKTANPPVLVTKKIPQESQKKNKIKLIVFFVALALAVLHIFYVSIPLLSENRGVNAFGVTTLLAVPMDQDLGQTVNARVVMVEKLELQNLQVGDKVLIYGRFGTDLNWVEEVVSIDTNQGTAETTFDGVVSNTVTLGDIKGIYIGNASLLGIITYVSSNLRGYIFLLGTYIVIFSMVYIFYIRKRKDKPIK